MPFLEECVSSPCRYMVIYEDEVLVLTNNSVKQGSKFVIYPSKYPEDLVEVLDLIRKYYKMTDIDVDTGRITVWVEPKERNDLLEEAMRFRKLLRRNVRVAERVIFDKWGLKKKIVQVCVSLNGGVAKAFKELTEAVNILRDNLPSGARADTEILKDRNFVCAGYEIY